MAKRKKSLVGWVENTVNIAHVFIFDCHRFVFETLTDGDEPIYKRKCDGNGKMKKVRITIEEIGG